MQDSFSSRTYNINTLLGRSSFPDFSAKKVKVPQFQRSYSWELTHVSSFWKDVFDFINQLNEANSTNTYFLGPIVILPEDDQINLLDGQQRLATATILLSVIRDIARQRGGQLGSDLARDIQRDLIFIDEDEGEYALTLSDLDASYFQESIQMDPPTLDVRAKLRSHILIKQARNFLNESVGSLIQGLGGKEAIILLKKFKNAFVERLKIVAIKVNSEDEAYLIFETLNDRGLRLAVPDLLLNHLMRTALNSKERKTIKEKWNTIIENLGQRKVSTYFRHFWVSLYGDVKAQSLFREIKEKLENQLVSSIDFAQFCSAESEFYVAITSINKSILGESSLYIEPLVKALSADKALPLLLSGIVCLEAKDFERLSKSVLNLVVRYSIWANLNPNTLENTLYEAARIIRKNKDLGVSSGKNYAHAKTILYNINPSDEQVKAGTIERTLTKKQAQFILINIAQKIQSPNKTFALNKNTIEHIFPEGFKKEDWTNADELEQFIWNIGNLTLLEPTLNREIGNKGFDIKKLSYSKSGILITSEISSKYKHWGPDEVKNRTQKMANIINDIWSFN